ncbi:MAG: hypothetical protein WCT04_08770 [Planctomycetota bacterium]
MSSSAFYRVSFKTIPPLDTAVFLTFSEPEKRIALLEKDTSGVCPPTSSTSDAPASSGPDFECVCILPQSPAADISRAETWIDPNGASAPAASERINLPGGWARVKLGRAVVCLPNTDWIGAITALADFAFHDVELRKLEREIATDWPRAEADLPLANDVTPDDLKRLGDIGAMTRLVWMRRIRLSKLERPLAKCQVPLPQSAKRLAARLRSRFDIDDRTETLDGQIEVYEYIYEMANQRMGEYGNFRKEFLLEILIVVLLAAELTVMLLEYYRNTMGE